MNGNFLKKVFSSNSFLEDYKEFMRNYVFDFRLISGTYRGRQLKKSKIPGLNDIKSPEEQLV